MSTRKRVPYIFCPKSVEIVRFNFFTCFDQNSWSFLVQSVSNHAKLQEEEELKPRANNFAAVVSSLSFLATPQKAHNVDATTPHTICYFLPLIWQKMEALCSSAIHTWSEGCCEEKARGGSLWAMNDKYQGNSLSLKARMYWFQDKTKLCVQRGQILIFHPNISKYHKFSFQKHQTSLNCSILLKHLHGCLQK